MSEKYQNTAARYVAKAYLAADHTTAATGKTLAVQISKNGGAFGNPAGGATNMTEIANGWYYVDLAAADHDTLGPLVIRATAAGVDDVEMVLQVVEKRTINGSVNDAAATTTAFIGSAGLSATNDFYNGSVLVFTSGTLAGLARKITDYVGATKTITVADAWPSAPANGSTFLILGRMA